MFKQFTIAIAATGLALSASAAMAREATPAPAPKAAPAPDAKTRYCLRGEVVTGSIVQGRMCKTLAQWRAEGVDPTKSN